MTKHLVFVVDFPPTVGGIQNYVANLCQELNNDTGSSVLVVAPRVEGSEEFDHTTGYKIIRCGSRGRSFPHRILTYALFILVGLRLAITYRFDVVHCTHILVGMVGLILHIITWKPFIIYCYGSEITSGKLLGLRWLLLRMATRVVSISQFTTNNLVKFRVKPARIIKVMPGVEIERFTNCDKAKAELIRQELGFTDKTKIILTVARISSRDIYKGQDMIIKALPQILAAVPDAVYVIVGRGSGVSRLEQLAEEYGVREHVKFAGYVGDEVLPLYYYACQVFAMPSRLLVNAQGQYEGEGFGIVYLEANVCGKPVLAGRSGGVEDAVIDEQTGLLVDPENPGEIATGLIRLLTDTAYADKLGKTGYLRAVSEFSWYCQAGVLVQAIKALKKLPSYADSEVRVVSRQKEF